MPATKMRFEFDGSIAIAPIRRVSASPSGCHEAPASVERNTPSPSYESTEAFASPAPAYTVFGLFGSIASAPIEGEPYASNTGVQLAPRFVDLKMPPIAAPK